MPAPGRPKNILKTKPVRISLTEPVIENLEILVLSGLYGKSSTDAAERLIARGIEELQKEGRLLQGIKTSNRK